MAATAAVFFTGQPSASVCDRASRARTSQKIVPAASTMCSPEIETM